MSVKKQIPSLCKDCSFWEKILEEFLDQTDVDSYFYHNIFDTSQSQHRIVRVSLGSNKKSFAIKLFHFCDIKTQQRSILQQEVNVSKREITCLVDSLRDFLKTFDHASKCIQIPRFPYGSPKLRLDLKSQKTISLLNIITISLNTQIDKFVYRSDLEKTMVAFFSSKTLNCTAINLFLQKLSTLIIAKFIICTRRTDFTLQRSEKNLRAVTMYSAFTVIVGMTIALLFSLGTCVVQIQNVRVNFACTKRPQSLDRNDHHCSQCASVCHLRIIPFGD